MTTECEVRVKRRWTLGTDGLYVRAAPRTVLYDPDRPIYEAAAVYYGHWEGVDAEELVVKIGRSVYAEGSPSTMAKKEEAALRAMTQAADPRYLRGLVRCHGMRPGIDEDPAVFVWERLGDNTWEASQGTEAATRRRLARRILVDGLIAANSCHSLGFAHRDIHPGNLVLPKDNGDGPVALIDFDLARVPGRVASYDSARGVPTVQPIHMPPAPRSRVLTHPLDVTHGGITHGLGDDAFSVAASAYIVASGGYSPFTTASGRRVEYSPHEVNPEVLDPDPDHLDACDTTTKELILWILNEPSWQERETIALAHMDYPAENYSASDFAYTYPTDNEADAPVRHDARTPQPESRDGISISVARPEPVTAGPARAPYLITLEDLRPLPLPSPPAPPSRFIQAGRSGWTRLRQVPLPYLGQTIGVGLIGVVAVLAAVPALALLVWTGPWTWSEIPYPYITTSVVATLAFLVANVIRAHRRITSQPTRVWIAITLVSLLSAIVLPAAGMLYVNRNPSRIQPCSVPAAINHSEDIVCVDSVATNWTHDTGSTFGWPENPCLSASLGEFQRLDRIPASVYESVESTIGLYRPEKLLGIPIRIAAGSHTWQFATTTVLRKGNVFTRYRQYQLISDDLPATFNNGTATVMVTVFAVDCPADQDAAINDAERNLLAAIHVGGAAHVDRADMNVDPDLAEKVGFRSEELMIPLEPGIRGGGYSKVASTDPPSAATPANTFLFDVLFCSVENCNDAKGSWNGPAWFVASTDFNPTPDGGVPSTFSSRWWKMAYSDGTICYSATFQTGSNSVPVAFCIKAATPASTTESLLKMIPQIRYLGAEPIEVKK